MADHAPTYHRPSYHEPAPTYHRPSYHKPKYEDIPANYNYAYAVQDDYAGVNFGQDESRSGHGTNGKYHVVLPDGRTQTVTYTVDGYGGYVADVQYSGEARYDEPAYHKPAYRPAPYHA